MLDPRNAIAGTMDHQRSRPAGSGSALAVLTILSNLLVLTAPLYMLQVYDRVLPSGSIPTLLALSGLVAVLALSYGAIEWLRARLVLRLGTLFLAQRMKPLIRVMLRPGGRPELVRDMDSIRTFYSSQAPLGLLDLTFLPIHLALVFMLHPLLGAVTACGATVVIVLLAFNELGSRRPQQQMAEATGLRQSFLEQVQSGRDTVVAMGMQRAIEQQWVDVTSHQARLGIGAVDTTAGYASATRALRLIVQCSVLGVGAALVIVAEASAGLIIAASIISARALVPVEQIAGNWRQVVAARLAYRRLAECLAGDDLGAAPQVIAAPRERLVVTQLSAAPGPGQRPLISDVSFELKAGEGVGVIGPSGSGKTSLVRALVGALPLAGGSIRLDAAELDQYDPDLLGHAIGYLPQQVDLFDGTIAANISRFDEEATTEQIRAAAEIAGIDDLVRSLPQGYATSIGAGGCRLSIGQRQRIGLARAVYGDPFLVVLDEPNASLDLEGEAALTRALHRLKQRGAALVVVAHRPSAIVALDKLLYLSQGRQVAFGPKHLVLDRLGQATTIVRSGTQREAANA